MKSFFIDHKVIFSVCILLYTVTGISQIRSDLYISVTYTDSVDAVCFYPRTSPPAKGYPAIIDVHGFGLSKETEIPFCTTYAAKGYVTLAYSVRGHGSSSGLSQIMSNVERNDLACVLSFVKSLPNIDSNSVGIIGSSQGGLHGLWAVTDQLPVKAIVSDVIIPSWASDMFSNGCIRRTFLNLLKTADVRWDPVRDTLWELVRRDMYDSLLEFFPRGRDINVGENQTSSIPLMMFLKWQDHYFSPADGIRSFLNLPEPKKLYVGTQGHWSDLSVSDWLFQSDQLSRWFQQFLKGSPSGILEEPQFAYSCSSLPIDSNGYFKWTGYSSPTWPPAGIELFRYYLHSDSLISLSTPSGSADSFYLGNKYLNPSYTFDTAFVEGFKGPRFDVVLPKSVRTFLSPVLAEDLIWIGQPKMRLFVHSDNKVFPLHVQIYEVDSTGNKYFINRINYTKRHWIPGSSAWIEVEGIPHAHMFSKGSRIGIEFTNIDKNNRMLLGNFPFVLPIFENCGVTIFYGPGYPSYIELPLIGNPVFVKSDEKGEQDKSFLLSNYPNPFNPKTIITLNIPVKSRITLKVYNILGEEVSTLVEGFEDAGIRRWEWDASAYSSGVYFVKAGIQPLKGSSSYYGLRKIILLK